MGRPRATTEGLLSRVVLVAANQGFSEYNEAERLAGGPAVIQQVHPESTRLGLSLRVGLGDRPVADRICWMSQGGLPCRRWDRTAPPRTGTHAAHAVLSAATAGGQRGAEHPGSPSSGGWGPPQGVPHRASATAMGRRRAAFRAARGRRRRVRRGRGPRAAAGTEGGAVLLWPLQELGSKSCVACQRQATLNKEFGSKS